jgi:hypothetical protein
VSDKDTSKIVKCRSCSADIFFITYKDKKHPVNAKPKKVFISQEDEFGNTMYWELVNGYESHFSSCPNSDFWRKKK